MGVSSTHQNVPRMLHITTDDPTSPSRAPAIPEPPLLILDYERARRGQRAFSPGYEVRGLGRDTEKVGPAGDAEVFDVVVEDYAGGRDDDAGAPVAGGWVR